MKTSKLLQAIAAITVASAALAAPAACLAAWGVSVSVGFAPPVLPGYLWTPGYWAYDPNGGYYWVPGTWVLAPAPGLLWTPGYWGFKEAVYLWHPGYWGTTVGFYGGVDYGFGYFGRGFEGGRWDHDRFFYNRAVANLGSVSITNVYTQPAHEHAFDGHVSYNGGPGGVRLAPTAGELAVLRAPHYAPTADQERHAQAALMTPSLRATVNHGRPPIAAAPRPAAFPHEAVRSRPEPPRQSNAGPSPQREALRTGQPDRMYAPANSTRPSSPASRPAERTPRPEPAHTREPAARSEPPALHAAWSGARAPAPRAAWNRPAQAPAPRAAPGPAPERASAQQRGGHEDVRREREPQRG